MTILNASISDLKEIETIENENFSKEDFNLSRGSLRYHLKNNRVFIIKDKNKILGYILWLERKSFFRLYSIAVLKQYHSKGFGKQLLLYSIERLRDKPLQLEVKIDNAKAVRLYESVGFEVVKTLNDYYPNNKDGYLMIHCIK